VCIPKQELRAWTIYPEEGAANNDCASRDRKEWSDERAAASYDGVMGADDADFDNLAKTVLDPIDLLLKLEVEGELPTYDQVRRLIANTKIVNWPTTIPEELGA